MREFEIDLQKMPLGKISKDQILKAYKVLNELQELIEKKSSRLQFLDASNRFFTIIPHDFGMNTPPLLDTADAIKVTICVNKINICIVSFHSLNSEKEMNRKLISSISEDPPLL